MSFHAVKQGVTAEEVREVISAIGFLDAGWTGQGHWYTCPNGHPYVIADCGGATMESTCPECGAVIGGEGHRLRAGVLSRIYVCIYVCMYVCVCVYAFMCL